jgi:hypothetical protein
MAKFCGKCGSALNATAVFCGGCGAKVPPPPPVAVTPVQPAWAPVSSSSLPAAPTPAPESAGFSPVPAGFAPVGSTFPAAAPTPTPAFSPEPAGFTPVGSSFPAAAPTPAPESAGFSPVPVGFAPVESTFPAAAPTPAPESAGFSPVLAGFTPVGSTFPAAAPPPESSGFSPVPAGFAPVGSSFPAAASTPTPNAGGFTPVQGGFTPVAPTTAPVQSYAPAQPAYTPIQASYTPTPGVPAAGTGYPAAGGKKSNTLLKVIVALVLVLFVGGALALAGLWYAAQKIKEKAHAAATQALAGNGPGSAGMGEFLKGVADLKGDSGSDGSAGGFKGDPCRFLSKEEVSKAVGIQVIRVEAKDEGCSYIAKGDPADVTSKHMASMVGGLSGADAKTQKTIQQLAGGLFAQQEANDKSLRAEAATGEVPVLGVSFTSGNAQAEMKMNRGAFNYVTGGSGTAASSGSGNLDGIGDEAYLAGGSMLIFRKGNSVAHFTYISCPCNTDNIKPLAKLVASRM